MTTTAVFEGQRAAISDQRGQARSDELSRALGRREDYAATLNAQMLRAFGSECFARLQWAFATCKRRD